LQGADDERLENHDGILVADPRSRPSW
jgi:hypothetical protein